MAIRGVVVDSVTKNPIVILEEIGGEKTLPIWIGFLEANAIASELEGVKYPRPMTHDLLKNILETMGIMVSRVEVCDLRDNTYFAQIHLRHKDRELSIDARPSDALALSLRVRAPIFVDEEVIKKSQEVEIEPSSESKSRTKKNWEKILENLDPEDFGNT